MAATPSRHIPDRFSFDVILITSDEVRGKRMYPTSSVVDIFPAFTPSFGSTRNLVSHPFVFHISALLKRASLYSLRELTQEYILKRAKSNQRMGIFGSISSTGGSPAGIEVVLLVRHQGRQSSLA
jgi:hypothetical protein